MTEQLLAGVLVLVIASFLFIAGLIILDETYDTIPFFSLSTSDTVLANNASAQTLTRPLTSAPTVTTWNRTWLDFDGIDDSVNITSSQGKNSTSLWYLNSTASVWTHIVFNSTDYFINGTTGTLTEYPINISDNNIRIGINDSLWFNGSIDEVRIYNKSLTLNEIAVIYNLGRVQTTRRDILIDTISNYTEIMAIDNGTATTLAYGLALTRNVTNVSVHNLTWLGFDGANDYVDIGEGILPTFRKDNNFTYSAWVNISSMDSDTAKLFSLSTHFDAGTNESEYNTGQLYFRCGNSTDDYIILSNTEINDSVWHHVVLVSNASATQNCSIYIDGTFENDTTFVSTQGGAVSNINYILGSTADSWKDNADEVRFYTNPISQTEITEVYNSGRVANKSISLNELLFWMPVNENSGTDIHTFNQTLDSNTSASAISGAVWRNSGYGYELVKDTDYSQEDNSSITVLNLNYGWDELTITYSANSSADSNLRFYFPFNENSGTGVHSFNSTEDSTTYASSINGATWDNDAIVNTLVENTSYTWSGDTFTVIDSDYAWSEINVSYSYDTSNQAKSGINNTIIGQGSFADYFDLIILAIVIAIVIGLISTIMVRRVR